ncbi:MAG: hypothetical protein Q8P73_01985 [bacterium]|nr:hypothetical protein [bacterium]
MNLLQFVWILLASLAIIGTLFVLLYVAGFWSDNDLNNTPEANFLVETSTDSASQQGVAPPPPPPAQ